MLLVAERQILASLAHPNIARLFDGGSAPAHQSLVVHRDLKPANILDFRCRKTDFSCIGCTGEILGESATVDRSCGGC